MWVAVAVGNKIAKVSTSGKITEYEVPTADSGPFGITWGPDGNMWFTERLGNKVASITTAGKITEYPLPSPSADLLLPTAGNDGGVWFTESDTNSIGRIETGARFTITSTAPSGNALLTRGRVPGFGRLSQKALIAGSRRTGCAASKSVARAGSYVIRCRLNKVAIAKRRKGSLRLVVSTTFRPTGATPRTIRRTVIFRAAKRSFSG